MIIKYHKISREKKFRRNVEKIIHRENRQKKKEKKNK